MDAGSSHDYAEPDWMNVQSRRKNQTPEEHKVPLDELVLLAGFRLLGTAPQRRSVVVVDGKAYG